MIEILIYLDSSGKSPFTDWAEGLHEIARAKVSVAVQRMEEGNFSSAKGVGEGVFESRIDFGPGYRVYFGRDGDRIVILLGGGTKKGQQRDITTAQQRWQDYKRRKAGK
jgi:putative addiction module killer protein